MLLVRLVVKCSFCAAAPSANRPALEGKHPGANHPSLGRVSGPFTYYEFFAGGGMARAGLGERWRCLFANDFDPVKTAAYAANWGKDHLAPGDVHALSTADLPERADLAWASSPCQDFSLAGLRKGLAGTRSSAFWGFWRLVQALNAEGRAPRIVVIENVAGLTTSHGGRDFTALCQALADEGYRFGALEVDAAAFLPQSRPRLFVIATREAVSPGLLSPSVEAVHGRRIGDAHARLPEALQAQWLAWRPLRADRRNAAVADLLEDDHAVRWHPPALTERLLGQLSPLQRERLAVERTAGVPRIGMAFRRTRIEQGVRAQRAEIRFDGIAGCLRTPGGGSSRQFVVEVHGARTRSRPLSAREGARLMGLPDSYVLPAAETAALKVIGDGVAVPVVRALAEQLLNRLLSATSLAAAE